MEIKRLPQHLENFPELKDPCVIKLPTGGYMLYASIGTSVTQRWRVGRFSAHTLAGPWQEEAPVEFTNLAGPQLCAPALHVQEGIIHMYIQTGCFEENTTIVHATSMDSQVFVADDHPVVTRFSTLENPHPIVGVYDAGISQVSLDGVETTCMVYSAYRRVGCGDMYVTVKDPLTRAWMRPQSILSQEHVPFHNDPSGEHFEWGLEGGKIEQLAQNLFILIGVCFLPRPVGYEGKRQRIFLAVSKSILGPFVPLGLPFAPSIKHGEIGHPDTMIDGDEMHIVYQERKGKGKPWYFRQGALPTRLLVEAATKKLTRTRATPMRQSKTNRYLFPLQHSMTSIK